MAMPCQVLSGAPTGIRSAALNVAVGVGAGMVGLGDGVKVAVGAGVSVGNGVLVGTGVAVGCGSRAEHEASKKLNTTSRRAIVFMFSPFLLCIKLKSNQLLCIAKIGK